MGGGSLDKHTFANELEHGKNLFYLPFKLFVELFVLKGPIFHAFSKVVRPFSSFWELPHLWQGLYFLALKARQIADTRQIYAQVYRNHFPSKIYSGAIYVFSVFSKIFLGLALQVTCKYVSFSKILHSLWFFAYDF